MLRNVKSRALAGLGAVALVGSLGMAGATAASASTTDCANSFGVNCGTFGNPTGSHTIGSIYVPAAKNPAWADVLHAVAANNQAVIGYSKIQGDPGSDFVQQQHQGLIPGADVNGTYYTFAYDPDGVLSGYCISNPNTPGPNGTTDTLLVLRKCNGLQWQSFEAVSTQFAFNHNRNRHPGLLSTTVPFVLVNVASDKLVSTSGVAPTPAPATETRQMDAGNDPNSPNQLTGNELFVFASPRT